MIFVWLAGTIYDPLMFAKIHTFKCLLSESYFFQSWCYYCSNYGLSISVNEKLFSLKMRVIKIQVIETFFLSIWGYPYTAKFWTNKKQIKHKKAVGLMCLILRSFFYEKNFCSTRLHYKLYMHAILWTRNFHIWQLSN